MPPTVLVEQPSDAASVRRLFAIALDPWTQEDLAGALGVARSAVSQWLTGKRAVAWHIVRNALQRTARRNPHAIPGMVEAIVLELLDAHGRWVPEEQLDLLDFGAASNRVVVAHAALLESVATGKGVEEAQRALIDASEACAAAAGRQS